MRTIFSQKEVDEFNQHPCIFHCSEKYIHYTYEFKKRALELYAQGISAQEIWRQAGFDPTRFNKNYTYSTLKDWKRMVEKKGIQGLENLGGVQYDRGKSYKNELIEVNADNVKRLELQVKYLQAENDFLAQLRAKRAESNSGQRKNSKSSKN